MTGRLIYSTNRRENTAQVVIADEYDKVTINSLRRSLDELEAKIQEFAPPKGDIEIELSSREGDATLGLVWTLAKGA